MTSLVRELQTDALNSDIKVSDLLRKALLVSRKLKITNMQQFFELELNGYKNVLSSEVPNYREMRGQTKVNNPHYGWQPVTYHNEKIKNRFTKWKTNQSAKEMESLLENIENSDDILIIEYSADDEARLRKLTGCNLSINLHIDISKVHGILDKIRNTILNWAINLEEEGILGESDGISFTKKEKEIDTRVINNINNYASVENQQIQQGNDNTQHLFSEGNVKELQELLVEILQQTKGLHLSNDQEKALQADIKTIQGQIESPTPKRHIIKELLSSVSVILKKSSKKALINDWSSRIEGFLNLFN